VHYTSRRGLRDEDEQATYLRELLDIFTAEGVDTVFVNTVARYDLPHRRDACVPREDLDMASYGIVKVFADHHHGHGYPDMPWEPKVAFTTLADCYFHHSPYELSCA
jgi:hypothetical protein